MASHLPSPPSSRPSSPDSSSSSQRELVEAEPLDLQTAAERQHQSTGEGSPKERLSERLDALLVSYLTILDTYTNLRAQLSKDLSGGFFALAQANRNANSTLGVGRRYGEEGFDERMKAGKVVKIREAEKGVLGKSCVEEEPEEVAGDAAQKSGRKMKKDKTPVEQAILHQDREDTETLKDDTERDVLQSDTTDYTFSVSPSSASNLSQDPLKWYGILIPPTLRTCQTYFATAVSSIIPEIVNVVSAMRGLEEEIWAARRQLGIVGDYESPNVDELQSKDDGNIESETTASKTAGDPCSGSLLSRAAASSLQVHTSQGKKSPSLLSTSPPTSNLRSEPRSRVLKLG
ncbi:uncharacterized protein PV07_03350 [Cladophialophora immunda]|uniref:Vacuolar ATPase assembly protein VMA22 n=1 Tax=Cladophialophora immunda TaxID=569365 RepID=A0A0D2CKN7_9EURO|nr:uncharacterized protein PV07_03350 [Cladophialophora immunda]KIW31753.1 hypothetical protein PV07_03350 [Cladophialophora immunda]OQV01390.1 hypothetical protein CLAIMM_06760 [Cladophialophora immunda]